MLNSVFDKHPLLVGAAGVGAAMGAATMWNQKSDGKPVTAEKYRPGDDYKDNVSLATDIVKELSMAGVHSSFHDIKTLLTFVFSAASGKPVDDREMMVLYRLGLGVVDITLTAL
jgi:hypothetical protein